MDQAFHIVDDGQVFESGTWLNGITRFNLVAVKSLAAGKTILFPATSSSSDTYGIQNIGSFPINIRVQFDKFPMVVAGSTAQVSTYNLASGGAILISYDNFENRVLVTPFGGSGGGGSSVAITNAGATLTTGVTQIGFDGGTVIASLDSPGGSAVTVRATIPLADVVSTNKVLSAQDFADSKSFTYINDTSATVATFSLPAFGPNITNGMRIYLSNNSFLTGTGARPSFNLSAPAASIRKAGNVGLVSSFLFTPGSWSYVTKANINGTDQWLLD